MTAVSQPELFNHELLAERLSSLGLKGVSGVKVHRNRSVIVSVTGAGILRIHESFVYADDRVLKNVVTFVSPFTRRAKRLAAQRAIIEFPVESYLPGVMPRRRRRSVHPSDRPLIKELVARYRKLATQYFPGDLTEIPIRVSRRMRRRLGELVLDPAQSKPIEIVISRAHIVADGWDEAEHTLLHEMVHQWQADTGRPVDHGAAFRAKAREVGIVPRAMRHVETFSHLCEE